MKQLFLALALVLRAFLTHANADDVPWTEWQEIRNNRQHLFGYAHNRVLQESDGNGGTICEWQIEVHNITKFPMRVEFYFINFDTGKRTEEGVEKIPPNGIRGTWHREHIVGDFVTGQWGFDSETMDSNQ